MNLKGLIELLEKLAAGWIMKDDRGKFYRRVHDVANRFLQQSSLRLKTRLHALTALMAVFTNVTLRHEPVLFLKEAENLLYYLFIEISKVLIGVEFLQLEEDNLTKRLFKKSIMDTSNLLKSIPNQRFFEALSNVVDSEWSHPTLLSLLRGDDVDKDTVLAYVKDVEHEDIVRLRIEALLASDCEDLAQKLIEQCLTSDVFINNPGILLRRFKCLYKSGNLEEFHQLCSKISSRTACEVLSKAAQSNCFGDNPSAALLLAQTFYLLDWMQPVDPTCTKFLLRNWMVLETHVGLKEEFGQALDKVLAVAHGVRQFVVFIDVAEELFGFKYAERCSGLGLRAIQQERHRLDCARLYIKDTQETDDANRSLAEICYILVRLYREHLQMHLCCLLSWFYLCPSENGFFMLERKFSTTANQLPSGLTSPPTVEENTYTRLFNVVELLRPDIFRSSYDWAALKPVLLCHMYRAGYRYDVGGNRFIKIRQKSRSVVITTQEVKSRNANTSGGHLASEGKAFPRKSNGVPSSEVNTGEPVKESKTEPVVTTTTPTSSSKSDSAESIEHPSSSVSSTSLPSSSPHPLPSDGPSVGSGSVSAAASPVVASSGSDAVSTAAPCLVVSSGNNSMTGAPSAIAISGNDQVSGELLSAADGNDRVRQESEEDDSQNSNAHLHKNRSCRSVEEDKQLKDCQDDPDEDDDNDAVAGQTGVSDQQLEESEQSSSTVLHGAREVDMAPSDEQHDEKEISNANDQETDEEQPNEDDRKESVLKEGFPSHLETSLLQLSKGENRQPDNETSRESGSTGGSQLPISCCLAPEANVISQHSDNKAADANAVSDVSEEAGNAAASSQSVLSTGSYDKDRKSQSLDMVSMLQQSLSHSELVLLLSHSSTSLEPSRRCLDLAADNNNEAVQTMKHQVRTVWSDGDISTCNGRNGLDVISSKLVTSSINNNSYGSAADCNTEEAVLCQRSVMCLPTTCLNGGPYSPKPAVANSEMVYEVAKTEPSVAASISQLLPELTTESLPLVMESSSAKVIGGSVPDIVVELLPVGKERNTFNERQYNCSASAADDDVGCEKADAVAVVQSSPGHVASIESNGLNQKMPSLFFGDIVLASALRQPQSESETSKSDFLEVSDDGSGIKVGKGSDELMTIEDDFTDDLRSILLPDVHKLMTLAAVNDFMSNTEAADQERSADAGAFIVDGYICKGDDAVCVSENIDDERLELEVDTDSAASAVDDVEHVLGNPHCTDDKTVASVAKDVISVTDELEDLCENISHDCRTLARSDISLKIQSAVVSDDKEPTLDDKAPALDDKAPAVDANVPTLEDKAPASDEKAHALDVNPPVADDKAQALDDKAHAFDVNVPTVDDKAHALDEKAPALDDNEPALEDKAHALGDNALAVDASVPTAVDQGIVAASTEDSQGALNNSTFVCDMQFALTVNTAGVKTSVENRSPAFNKTSSEDDKALDNNEDVGQSTAIVLDESGSADCVEEMEGISPWQNVPQSVLQRDWAFARHFDAVTGWKLQQQKVEGGESDFDMSRFPVAVIGTSDNDSLFVTPTNLSFCQTIFPNLEAIQDRSTMQPGPSAEQRSCPSAVRKKMAKNSRPKREHRSTEPELKNIPVSSDGSVDSGVGKAPPQSSVEEYQCNICNKVLNSSWGHRLHAIRVHQADCVDEMSPGKGYKCRQCQKLVALNTSPYKNRKRKAVFCNCKNRSNRKRCHSMLPSEEGRGSSEVRSIDGLAQQQQQQLDVVIAPDSAIHHESPQKKARQLDAVETEKEENSGPTSVNDNHQEMVIRESEVKENISCCSCLLPLTLCHGCTDTPVSSGRLLCSVSLHNNHLSTDRLEMQPCDLLLSDSSQFKMNGESTNDQSKMDSKDGQSQIDLVNGQSEIDLESCQPEMDSKNGLCEMYSKDGQSNIDSKNAQSEMESLVTDVDSKSGQSESNSRNGQFERDSKNGQCDMDLKNGQCEMDSKNGQSGMDSRNGQSEIDSGSDRSEIDSKTGQSEIDSKNGKCETESLNGQSQMDSMDGQSEMSSKTGQSAIYSKDSQSNMNSDSGQYETESLSSQSQTDCEINQPDMDSSNGHSQMVSKNGLSELKSLNDQFKLDSKSCHSELDSRNGQCEMDSKNGQSQIDLVNAQSKIDLDIGQPEMEPKNGLCEMDSKDGQSNIDSKNSQSEMKSLNGQSDVDSKSGQSESDSRNGRFEKDSKNGHSDMDSKNDQYEMDSKNGQSEMDSRNGQSEIDSESCRSEMDSKSGQSEIDSKNGKSEMESLNGQSQMDSKSCQSQMDSMDGQCEMDSKTGQSAIYSKESQSNMNSNSGQSEMESLSCQSQMDCKSDQPDIDSSNGQSQMVSKNGQSELESLNDQFEIDSNKSCHSELDSRNGQFEMDSKNGQCEMDSKNGQFEMDSKNGQCEMDLKNGQCEMDSKNGQCEMDSRDGQFDKYSKNGEDCGLGKLLPQSSVEEYQCNICKKVLNSSWGHRLHAIRVHQADCVDEMSPGKGYKCRQCQKLVALNTSPYKNRKTKAVFCYCKNRSNRKRRHSILASEEGRGSAEVRSIDGLAQQQQQLDIVIAPDSAIDHAATRKKARQLDAVETEKEENSGPTSVKDENYQSQFEIDSKSGKSELNSRNGQFEDLRNGKSEMASDNGQSEVDSRNGQSEMDSRNGQTDLDSRNGQFVGDLKNGQCEMDSKNGQFEDYQSKSGLCEMNIKDGQSTMKSLNGQSLMDFNSGQPNMDSTSGQIKMYSKSGQSEMESLDGHSQVDSKSGQPNIDSWDGQSEMDSKNGQSDMNSWNCQCETDSKNGHCEKDSKSGLCEMNIKDGQSTMKSLNGQSLMDFNSGQPDMDSTSGQIKMYSTNGQSELVSEDGQSEICSKNGQYERELCGQSQIDSKSCQSDLNSMYGQSETYSKNGQSELDSKNGQFELDSSKNGQSQTESVNGQSEIDSKSGQSESDSTDGQPEMDSQNNHPEKDSLIGQSEIESLNGQSQIDSKSGQSEMVSEKNGQSQMDTINSLSAMESLSGQSQIDSKSGQSEMVSANGQSRMDTINSLSAMESSSGQSQMDSKSGESELDSKDGRQSQMDSKNGQCEMDSNIGQSETELNGQSQMDSKSGQSEWESKDGQSEMDSKNAQCDMDSKSSLCKMDTNDRQSALESLNGHSQMDSKMGQTEMDSTNGQFDMVSENGQSQMESNNGESETELLNGQSQMDSKSDQSELDSVNGQFEIDSKTGQSQMDTKNGQSGMESLSCRSQMDSKIGESELDSKDDQSWMDSRNGQCEMDSNIGQSETELNGQSQRDSKSGQSELESKDGQSEMNSNNGQCEMDSTKGQFEMASENGQSQMESNNGQSETKLLNGQSQMDSKSDQSELDSVNGQSEIDSKTGQSQMDSKNDKSELDSKNSQSETESFNGQSEIDSKGGQPDIHSTNGRPEMDSHSGQLEMDPNQSQTDSKTVEPVKGLDVVSDGLKHLSEFRSFSQGSTPSIIAGQNEICSSTSAPHLIYPACSAVLDDVQFPLLGSTGVKGREQAEVNQMTNSEAQKVVASDKIKLDDRSNKAEDKCRLLELDEMVMPERELVEHFQSRPTDHSGCCTHAVVTMVTSTAVCREHSEEERITTCRNVVDAVHAEVGDNDNRDSDVGVGFTGISSKGDAADFAATLCTQSLSFNGNTVIQSADNASNTDVSCNTVDIKADSEITKDPINTHCSMIRTDSTTSIVDATTGSGGIKSTSNIQDDHHSANTASSTGTWRPTIDLRGGNSNELRTDAYSQVSTVIKLTVSKRPPTKRTITFCSAAKTTCLVSDGNMSILPPADGSISSLDRVLTKVSVKQKSNDCASGNTFITKTANCAVQNVQGKIVLPSLNLEKGRKQKTIEGPASNDESPESNRKRICTSATSKTIICQQSPTASKPTGRIEATANRSTIISHSQNSSPKGMRLAKKLCDRPPKDYMSGRKKITGRWTCTECRESFSNHDCLKTHVNLVHRKSPNASGSLSTPSSIKSCQSASSLEAASATSSHDLSCLGHLTTAKDGQLMARTGQCRVVSSNKTSSNKMFSNDGGKTSNANLPENCGGRSGAGRNTKRKLNAVHSNVVPCSKMAKDNIPEKVPRVKRRAPSDNEQSIKQVPSQQQSPVLLTSDSEEFLPGPVRFQGKTYSRKRQKVDS